MKLLTTHFSYEELGLIEYIKNESTNFEVISLEVDPRIIINYIDICTILMEPIRERWGAIIVHDGYRNPEHNKEVGGKKASFHQALEGKSAVDFHAKDTDIIVVFDWIRLGSKLNFDKVILEYKPNTNIPACIHIQYDRNKSPRRLAYEGFTGDSEKYASLPVI